MSDLNFADCIGCGLCVLGCPAYEETGFDVLTARGRNKGLQAGLTAAEMDESIWACTFCGYCDAICPNDVHNVQIVLNLRRELVLSEASGRVEGLASQSLASGLSRTVPVSKPLGASGFSRTMAVVKPPLVLGCTIRERAPHLIPSIREFLGRIGLSSDAEDTASGACCGSLDVEAGRALPSRAKAGVVADPICLEQYDAAFLGALAMQHLELFDLEPPFYYYAPHRLVNRDHARMYPLYDGLRRRFDCDMNFDLNRLARSTSAGSVQGLARLKSAGSVQGLSGDHARDIRAAVARLLAHSRAERIVTCSPADYLAFKAYSGRDTRFITECLR